MIKTIITMIITCHSLMAFSFTGGKPYTIKGTTDVKEGKAILRQNDHADTVKILNGKFSFKGIAGKPAMAILELLPLGGVPTQLVLEPGQLSVTEKKGRYTVGGSVNNKRLQYIQDQLASYNSSIQTMRKQLYELRGIEQRKLQAQIDSVSKLKVAHASRLVQADSSFAGYITMLSFYQRTSATEIRRFLEEFRSYAGEEGYKQVEEHFARIPKADVGLVAPGFTLQNTEGKQVSLADFRGKYVLLDFWFVDCGFCRKQAPGFVNVYRDLHKKGFEILGISIDPLHEKEKWLEAIRHDKASWTQVLDHEQTLPGQYGVEGYPTMFLVDPDGIILRKIVGFHDEEKIREVLGKYIK